VLMLTANRVGSFDEAFRSRIHISLYYPKLGKEKTCEIWKMDLRRIKEAKDVNIDIDEEGITKFYKKHWQTNKTMISRRWNGRQIKNTFQTALALANWDFHTYTNSKLTRPSPDASHFKQVAETSNHFDDYLVGILKEGEDRDEDVYAAIARREHLREGKDRGPRGAKQRTRRDRSEDSSSGTPNTDSDKVKRKHLKKEKKKSKSKAKKTHLSGSVSDSSASESEGKTRSSDLGSEDIRKKRKAAKEDTKKRKSKSKEIRNDADYSDVSGSD
jgi:hypothetical protein